MEHHGSIIITLEILLTQTSTSLQLYMDPDIHDYVHILCSQVLTKKTCTWAYKNQWKITKTKHIVFRAKKLWFIEK